MQNKRVLSVAQSTEQKDGKPQLARSITLEVTPEEAEKLSLAATEGQITLALRGLGDDNSIVTIGANKRDLLAIAAAPARKLRVGQYAVPPPINIELKLFTAVTVTWWNSKWEGEGSC